MSTSSRNQCSQDNPTLPHLLGKRNH
jgi:hypothetical protein